MSEYDRLISRLNSWIDSGTDCATTRELCDGAVDAICTLRNSLRAEGDRISELKDELAAERQRAKLPEDLAERLRERVAFYDAEGRTERGSDLLRGILAWHEQ